VSRAPVLVVEDDPDVRDMIATTLELDGEDVLTAANGLEAIRIARTRLPRLIILDLMMPVMTGEEFRQAQLAQEAICDIPVVVVSAHHQAPEMAARMKAAGCLCKPIDIEELQALVKQW
jgi:CheY-like chemotaxis protein